MQFGMWSELLSIDEQMVPYFGRHSSKMFIHGKPIRFGFENVEFPKRQQLYFDNFFTSYHLLCFLGEKGISSTGTVRSNRVADGERHLKTGKTLPRGEYDYTFDSTNKITLC